MNEPEAINLAVRRACEIRADAHNAAKVRPVSQPCHYPLCSCTTLPTQVKAAIKTYTENYCPGQDDPSPETANVTTLSG